MTFDPKEAQRRERVMRYMCMLHGDKLPHEDEPRWAAFMAGHCSRDTEVAALEARVERLTSLLRACEWHEQKGNYAPECPVCCNFECDGHEAGCSMAAALAEGERS